MLIINKVRADHVIDFAAEELKKYIRMMMPEGGDVRISYAPEATGGFRLGLLEDFGLANEAEDPRLDDVIHVETTADGGILAGSNPRSVLFAVYRMLKENGCRWLYPGVDGEHIPMKDLEPVRYHKLADHRFRGFCNEGSESQTCMLECADFYAKLEMNVYMLEWFIPDAYYQRYYTHLNNDMNRMPEPLTEQQVLQWKRQCEAEIAKRGLMFHDIGHGWNMRAFGFPDSNVLNRDKSALVFSEEEKSVLALVNGRRDFVRNDPVVTNLCMSQPRVRKAFAKCVADYAQNHENVDYLHVWLSDGTHTHCECEECQKMRPADWYIMIMNEIDEELTARNLNTRIVFICYLDTFFAPEHICIKNPERFSLLYAPVSRAYESSFTEESIVPPPKPYIRNGWERPWNAEENFAFLKDWRRTWKGPAFSYEYHFWRHQYLDPGGRFLAKRLYEDVRSLRLMGLDGYVEDGSQRSGFPNGFPVYIYAETLMNRDCDYDAVCEDYFSHIYGDDWKQVDQILTGISNAFDMVYMEGVKSVNKEISDYYDPARVERLSAVADLCAQERALAKKHLNMPTRPQTVSWRMLLRHAEYCEKFAELMIEKALGHNFKAIELAQEFRQVIGRFEMEIEPYYDHGLACRVLDHILQKPKGIILE